MSIWHRRNGRGLSDTCVIAVCAVVLAGVHAPALLSAQVTAADSTLRHVRLGDLYAEIDQRSPRTFAARALARAANARVAGVTRPPDPQVQLGFMNYAVPRLAPMVPLGMTQLQVMQMLPLAGKLSLAGRVARAQSSVAMAQADEVSWGVRRETAMAFYDLYVTDVGLDVARESLRLLSDIAAITEAMYRVGDGQQADVLRAHVAIARMAEDTLRMQAMRESLTAQLNALLDRTQPTTYGSPVLPAFPHELPLRASLDSMAMMDRATVRAGRESVGAAQASEALARKAIIPDLTVGVQYGQRGGENGGTERMASLMLGVSVPVFARSRQYQMREEASAMRQMAESELSAVRAETRGKIGEAYAALTRARRLLTLYQSTVLPQSEAAAASALTAYRVGRVDFMTLLDSRMSVIKYRQELVTIQADEGKAWVDLEMLVGRALVDPQPSTSTGKELEDLSR